MKNRPSSDHVTIGEGGKVTCHHCKESVTMNMPAEVTGWLKVMNAFTEHHRYCPAPEMPAFEE